MRAGRRGREGFWGGREGLERVLETHLTSAELNNGTCLPRLFVTILTLVQSVDGRETLSIVSVKIIISL